MALPPPKCSCRSQAAHGFQRDMPAHLGVRVALEYVFYGPLGGSALPKQGGGVSDTMAAKNGIPRGGAACRTSSSVRRSRPRVWAASERHCQLASNGSGRVYHYGKLWPSNYRKAEYS